MSEGGIGKEKARIHWEWMLEHPERVCVCTDGTACYCYYDEGVEILCICLDTRSVYQPQVQYLSSQLKARYPR